MTGGYYEQVKLGSNLYTPGSAEHRIERRPADGDMATEAPLLKYIYIIYRKNMYNVKNGPEAMNAGAEGGINETGQTIDQREADLEAQRESLGNSPEKSPETEITDTVRQLDNIDQEIFAAQKSAAEKKTRLAALREGMGMPSGSDNSPAVEFQNERIQKLQERRVKLDEQKESWIKQYGRENLPDGLVLDNGEGGRKAKGGSFEDEQDQELSEEEKKEDLELRKRWLEKWEQDAVKHFEEAMRGDWRTKGAMNLDLTIQLMKLRVPKAMDKEAKAFVNGTVDEPPFSTVWIKWQTSSPFERIFNKPNWISKLEITFDDEVKKIADDSELKKEEEKDAENENAEPETAGLVR